MNNAVRNRGVLALGCVLVALGSLLCFGKESPAKQPDQIPEPGTRATSHQPTSPQPSNHGPAAAPDTNHRAPAAQATPQEPAPREPVDRIPSSRPAEQRPAAAAGGRDPAHGRPAEPPDRQIAPPERPVHEQSPAPGPKPAPEPAGLHKAGREPAPLSPVGPEQARQQPRPERVERGHLPRPVPERSAPKTTPPPQGDKSTGQQEGLESPVQRSKPASPPGKENVHPKGKSSVGPSEQAPQRPEQGMAAGPKPDKTGHREHDPATLHKKSPVDESPASAVTPASPGMRTEVPPDHKAPARTLASQRTGPQTTPGANPTYRQAGTEGGTFSTRSVGLRDEEPARVAEPSPASVPDHGVVRSSQTAVSAAPRGGMQSPAGEQGASGTSFGATKFLLDPLWDERSSLVDLTEAALRKASGSPKVYSSGTLHRGSLTQRGPPLEIPQPFSGFVFMGGGAFGSGASGNGAAPLLAVIVVCLLASLCLGWFRIFCASLRPGTVYRPVLERPG